MSMPDEPLKPQVRHSWTFGAAVVAVIGLVILTISGLCTSVMGFGTLYAVFSESGSLRANEWAALSSTLEMILLIGGIPMLIGFFIARAGFKMRKKE